MSFRAPCPVCIVAAQRASGKTDKEKLKAIRMLPGRLTDEGYIFVQCPNGHKAAVIFDERKHELLLQSACHALLARHEREAVSGFATALERAHEFFVRVICRSKGLSAEVMDRMLRSMARQSERQFGCFLVLHALEVGRPYEADEKKTAFRNRVVHQGYIPPAAESWDYGEFVFLEMLRLSNFLTQYHAKSVKEDAAAEVADRKLKVPAELNHDFVMRLKPINVDLTTMVGQEITSFEDFLDAMNRGWSPPPGKEPRITRDMFINGPPLANGT